MILYTSIIIVILALTRTLAYLGIYFLKENEIILIKDVFHLTYVENTGAAFGIFSNSTMILSIIGIVMALVITYIVASKKILPISYKILLALLSGGGIANVWDRLSFGFVVDYFNFCLINYPVFNLADIFVVVSCVWLAIKIAIIDEKGKE